MHWMNGRLMLSMTSNAAHRASNCICSRSNWTNDVFTLVKQQRSASKMRDVNLLHSTAQRRSADLPLTDNSYDLTRISGTVL